MASNSNYRGGKNVRRGSLISRNVMNNRRGPQQLAEKPKEELPANVMKLLASLEQAQQKTNTSQSSSSTATSSSNVKKPLTTTNKTNINHNQARTNQTTESNKNTKNQTTNKKKPQHRKSVAARMEQQMKQTSASNSGASVKKQHQPSNDNYRIPKIPEDVLDDLEFRFISNMPEADKHKTVRICFQVELAHWFYIDHIVGTGERKDCPNVGQRDFTKLLFSHCIELKHLRNRVDDAIAEWREYKATVPTYGAILIDESLENVLLVQSYFAKGNSWGFPKGKINQNEPPRECAIRETCEETGFDFGTISDKEKRVQKFINDSMIRLYLVPNVPSDFPFAPQTRKEIRKIEWFKINDLPTERGGYVEPYLNGFNFYMVIPFVNDIQKFAEKEKAKRAKTRSPAHAAPSNAITKTEMPPALFQLFQHAGKPAAAEATPPPPKPAPPLDKNFEKTPILKRLTSEELFSSIKKSREQHQEQNSGEISRPTLPDMSPSVNGLDSLATFGICTPLRPGASLNQFNQNVNVLPMMLEEVEPPKQQVVQKSNATRDLFHEIGGKLVKGEQLGFVMPETLQNPVVIASSSFNHQKRNSTETYHGWLDSQLVNTIMHAPNPSLSSSPGTPTNSSRSLGHLIIKPIQPQPIVPQKATATAMGSAEKPQRSSRISLSDNSAFTAISSGSGSKQSTPKPTAPPPMTARVESRASTITPTQGSSSSLQQQEQNQPLPNMSLFDSIISPVPSGMRSTNCGSTSSISISVNNEVSLINNSKSSLLSPENTSTVTAKLGSIVINIPLSTEWKKPVKVPMDTIMPPTDVWERAFSVATY